MLKRLGKDRHCFCSCFFHWVSIYFLLLVRMSEFVDFDGQDKMKMCPECYSEKSRVTPLLKAEDCLKNHTQYLCGTCGRCICIERDKVRGLQRWNFPFKTFEIAMLYLRTADFTMKKSCGIYEIAGKGGRKSYKIFSDISDLNDFLKKNADKSCEKMSPMFEAGEYKEHQNTEVRKLTAEEIKKYLSERLN